MRGFGGIFCKNKGGKKKIKKIISTHFSWRHEARKWQKVEEMPNNRIELLTFAWT